MQSDERCAYFFIVLINTHGRLCITCVINEWTILQILVDADACPLMIKEILCKAAVRTKIVAIFVANHKIALPVSEYIRMKKVGAGFDVADAAIVSLVTPGDLVITADIPLAYEAVKKGGFALNPRGQLYTNDTIQVALAHRDLMTQLRDSGMVRSGCASLSKSDRQDFANHLDRILTHR
jgi:uncharacterized protein YaiI (UPF0178 family)